MSPTIAAQLTIILSAVICVTLFYTFSEPMNLILCVQFLASIPLCVPFFLKLVGIFQVPRIPFRWLLI